MKEPYFVMLKHPQGEWFLPLVDDKDEIVQFKTVGDARAAAKTSSLGSEVGYKVFDFTQGYP